MKTIIAFLVTCFLLNSVNAQLSNRLQARIEKGAVAGGFDVYLKFTGTSPFFAGNHSYIFNGQLPIAVTVGSVTPGTPTISLDPNFLNGISNAGSTYSVAVNPLKNTVHTANAGEAYYSINITADPTVTEQTIVPDVEFRLLTVTFPSSNLPDAAAIKLMNVSYRFAPSSASNENLQGQLAIEDNHANEYTDPFAYPSTVFYEKASFSSNGAAGTSASLWGITPSDYNSWSSPATTQLSVPVNVVGTESISLTSNPIQPGTKLLVRSSLDQRINYIISDAGGRKISDGSIDILKGTGTYSIDNLSALANGNYYLATKSVTINNILKISKVD